MLFLLRCRNRDLLQLPQLRCVLLNGPVGGELAGAGGVENGHLCPFILVLIGSNHIALRRCIGFEILQDEIAIGRAAGLALEQGIVQRPEQLRILRCVGAVDELHQNLAYVLIVVEDSVRIVAAVVLVADDLLRGEAEDEHVLLADLLGNLHIGAVHGADGQGSVEHQLHAARTGRLLGGRGNLL